MIGIVVVTHGGIGCEMVNATHRIFQSATHMRAVAVESNDPPEAIKDQIATAISDVDHGRGILILTDMFGGTPSNICLSFLKPNEVEVVSGVNLPMLVKLADIKPDADFAETVTFIQQYGQRNIVIASQVLSKNMKDYKT